MKIPVTVLATALLASCPLSAQAPAPNASNVAAYVNHLMDVHVGVERTVPPGWSITVKPVATERGPQDTINAQVHIFIKGAPEGTLFEQQAIAVEDDQSNPEIGGISVGKDGILMCAGRTPEQCGDAKNPDDPIEFTVQGSLKGEPYRFLFVSDAGTIGTVFVVNPVGNKNGACTLSAVRLTRRFELALITGVGFPPDTDIHYTASPGPGGDKTIRSNDIGVVRFSLLPFMKPGQKSGTTKVKITEKQYSPEVSYEWGEP